MRMRTLLLSTATLGALALLVAVGARREGAAGGSAAAAVNAAPSGNAAPAGNPASAGCAVRGPIPLGNPVTAAEREAVPLAFQGNVVVSVAWGDRLTIIDLATGRQRSVESGIDGPHELAVS